VAAFGDFSGCASAGALASYVGAVPALKQSGKRTFQRASLTPIGAARLRAKLWMPVLTAVRTNPWLRAYYERLIARGKLPKVALVGRDAEVAACRLQRGHSSSSLRGQSRHRGGPPVKNSLDGRHGIS
jgi:transposase